MAVASRNEVVTITLKMNEAEARAVKSALSWYMAFGPVTLPVKDVTDTLRGVLK